MERAFLLSGVSEEKLPLSKYTVLHVPGKLLHLDELPDSTWRLTVSSSFIPDFKDVQALRLHGLSNGVPKPFKGVSLEVVGLDTRIELAKVVGIKSPTRTFQLSEGKGGQWQLLYSTDLVPDIKRLQELTVHRVD